MKTGSVNLPLHGGKCPPWLFNKMKNLSAVLLETVVLEYGPTEVLKRFSDPLWFQSFGCLLGFDWHSSGLTTTVCGAVKAALKERNWELGIFIAGGKGGTSRKTPQEIEEWGEKFAFPQEISKLVYASKMAAKVDSAALQDGYQLYHHTFIFTPEGNWAVVQQGMNEQTKYARRYHWLSRKTLEFVNEPHEAVCCNRKGKILNLVASESEANRATAAALSREKPHKIVREFKKICTPKNLTMPAFHNIPRAENLERALIKIYEKCPKGFEELLSLQGVGPKTIRALSLVAEVIYGAKPSYRDPVRYSFAHGGKDGTPYPVDRALYQNTINSLRKIVEEAKMESKDKIQMLKKLSNWSEMINTVEY
ncbi:MAG: DUF763 domain-containing protein [Clostridia bacterium]|nr:DUF763 domain-containing protein [Clostridia bacterium]